MENKISKKKLNDLYSKIYGYNYNLMHESENLEREKEYGFDEVYDFYLTSHILSYIKSLFKNQTRSLGLYFNVRCIIEGLALKVMYLNKGINEKNIDLLRQQFFLIEYRYYSRFNDIADKILLPEKLEIDYQNAVNYFNNKLSDEFTESQIKEIIRSKIPFICKPYLSFRKIIENNLGKEIAEIYGFFSSIIHPSLNTDYKLEDENRLYSLFPLIEKLYGNLPQTEMTVTKNLSIAINNTSKLLLEFTNKETNAINKIANSFEKKFNNNYVSNTLKTLRFLLEDIIHDKIMGLSEQVKCKWKIAIELFSVFNHVYFDCILQERYGLMIEHSKMQTAKNFDESYNTEKAFDIYRNLYKSNDDKEKFDKGFQSILGYLIDENYKVKSLSEIVKEFAKYFESVSINKINLSRVMQLDYVESQMLSHANGYMWFANSGAWQDINNIFIAFDESLLFILKKLHALYSFHKEVENNGKYIDIIVALEAGIKSIEEILPQKIKIFSSPMVMI